MEMAPEREVEHLTDEEYLIFRAKEEQNIDQYAAKSWLITAQILFPQNFGIQFEVYQIEKNAKNVKEAAKCLGTLLREFPHEPALWGEVDGMMSALRSHNLDSSISFMSQLFHTLPKDVQREMVVSAAERCQDTMEHCHLMLLLTSTFPEAVVHHGLKLVETIIGAEKHLPNPGPLNPFRKLLVCELLPQLLKAQGLEVRPKTLHNLLTRAIEFYVAYVTTPTKTAQAALNSPGIIEEPWQELFSAVQMIGWNLSWELASGFDAVGNRELILQRIQNFIEGGGRLGSPNSDSGEDVRQVLYTTLTIFLHALLDYTKRLFPDLSQESIPNSGSPPLVLVEAFVTREREDQHVLLPKRPRTSIDEDTSMPLITVSKFVQGSTPARGVGGNMTPPSATPSTPTSPSGLSQALITAIKCWDLLNSYEQLRAEFMRFMESLGMEKWWMLSFFTVDVLIYHGRLVEASRELRHALRAPQVPMAQLPTAIIAMKLKLASVLYAFDSLSAAAEAALEVVGSLPSWPSGGMAQDLTVTLPQDRRHLHLLALTRPQCLQFITTLLIYALRQRVLAEQAHDDICIGHLIVLIQYEWPKHEHIFEEVVRLIKKRGGLSYALFNAYVTTPDILEEFMYLATFDGGILQLDIIPINVSNKQQRISTRGADRGSKHDFKMGMKRQMLRSDEPVEINIITFLLSSEGMLLHENLI